MKSFIIFLFLLLMLSPGLASCGTDKPEPLPETGQPTTPEKPGESDVPDDGENGHDNLMSNKLNIRVDTSVFTITLEDNATTRAFKALLPLTLDMSELNGNEKFYNFATNLPTAAVRPGTIRAGDLMLYGSNCLVLFYKMFSSSYSYTRLGSVDNPSGLTASLGSGRVNVTFEIIKK